MLRRTFLVGAAASALALVAPSRAFAQAGATTAPPLQTSGGALMAAHAQQAGYAPANGLELYYEIHGTGQPLILIHGGLDTIETAFGTLLPALARSRQVIAGYRPS